MGMENNYLDPYKYEFDNEYVELENEYQCVCDGEQSCDCVYDPVRGRLVQKGHEFYVEQDEE